MVIVVENKESAAELTGNLIPDISYDYRPAVLNHLKGGGGEIQGI